MISDTQKTIYNLYLKASRKNLGKPYRLKRNFTDVKEQTKNELIKLENFFKKYPHLLGEDFFNAPYKIYTNDEKRYYGLDFYSSQKGLITCINYYKFLIKTSPDNQIEHLKNSLKFICNFCIEKNISLDGYANYKSVAQNDCFKHLKEHSISWYVIWDIPHMHDLLYNMPVDEFELYFGDIQLADIYAQYSAAKNAKDVLKKGVTTIRSYIQKKLKRP